MCYVNFAPFNYLNGMLRLTLSNIENNITQLTGNEKSWNFKHFARVSAGLV